VDPEYTIFAFGGTIPKGEISCEGLVLRVWKGVSEKEGDVKDNTDEAGGTEKEGKEGVPIEDGEGGGGKGSGDFQE